MVDVGRRKKPPRLPIGERIAASAYGAKAHWPSGFQLYQRGAAADGVFVVLHGHVVLRSPIKGGRGFVSAIVMSGETFGAEGLANEGIYATDAIAAEGAETLHLGASQYRAFVREQPSHALALTAQIMVERTALLERLHEMAAMNVEERLMLAVLRLGDDAAFTSDEGLIRLESSHQRLLCEMVGATRESTTLGLSRMIASGAGRRMGSTIVVDPRQLTERARAALYDIATPLQVEREVSL